MCIGISAVDDDNVDDNIEVYFFVAVKFIFYVRLVEQASKRGRVPNV